jgi:hypothetical protein
MFKCSIFIKILKLLAYINPLKSSSRYSRHWAVASWGDNLATDLS